MINVTGGVLVYNNKIILTKRASTLQYYPNLYEFPGGKIEKNETCKQALKRELEEELSINVEINDIKDFIDNNRKYINKSTGQTINLRLFIIKKWKGWIKLNEKIHSKIKFIKQDTLETIQNVIPGNKKFFPILKNINLLE